MLYQVSEKFVKISLFSIQKSAFNCFNFIKNVYFVQKMI